MASFTDNLNLEKPAGTDLVSPNPFNDNSDIIDSEFVSKAKKNYLINSNFDIAQRGTGKSGANLYGFDRWVSIGNVVINSSTDVPNSDSKTSCQMIANDALANRGVRQRIESKMTRGLEGSNIIISFWIKTDQNIIDSSPYVRLSYANSVDDFSSTTSAVIQTFGEQIVEGVWTIIQLKFTDLPVGISNGLQVSFDLQGLTAPVVAGTVWISQMKLEVNDYYTKYIPPNYASELLLCQRYYYKSYNIGVLPGTSTNQGCINEINVRNAANFTLGAYFNVSMRSVPTVTIYSNATGAAGYVNNNGDKVATAQLIGENGFGRVVFTSGSTSYPALYQYTADAEL